MTGKERPKRVPSISFQAKVACSNLYITVGLDKSGQPFEVFINGSKSGGCYDDKTEILTDEGWKFFKDLDRTEKVATLNLENNCLEYQKPTVYQDYAYEGVMFEVLGKSYDLLLTPDHKLLYRKKSNVKGGFILQDVEKVYNKERFTKTPNLELKRNCSWYGTNDNTLFVLPEHRTGMVSVRGKTYFRTKRGVCIDFKLWLNFLGYYLSEGCSKDGEVSLFQKTDSPCFEKMKQSVQQLGFNYNVTVRRGGNARIRFSNVQISSYLSRFGKSENKYIPRDVLNLPKEYLSVLAQSMFEGDGCFENGRYRTYATVSKRMSDDVSELLIKLGYGVSISKCKQKNTVVNGKEIHRQPFCYLIGASSTHTTPELTGRNIKQRMYIGNVYCCTVPNSTLLVRRNGKIVWCGNCRTNQEAIARLTSALLRNGLIADANKQLLGLVCPSCQRWKGEIPKDQRAQYPSSCADAIARALSDAVKKEEDK